MSYISDDPHDDPRAVFIDRVGVIPHQHLLANRIFIRKKLARKRFIHDDRPHGGGRVMLIQIASLFQRNPQRLEKSRHYFVVPDANSLVRRWRGMSENRECVTLRKMRGKAGDRSDGLDPRQRRNSRKELHVKSRHLRCRLFHISTWDPLDVSVTLWQL